MTGSRLRCPGPVQPVCIELGEQSQIPAEFSQAESKTVQMRRDSAPPSHDHDTDGDRADGVASFFGFNILASGVSD